MECHFVTKRPNLCICYYKLLWSKCHIHGWPKNTDRLNVTCDRATQFRDILTWTYNPSNFCLKVTVTLLSQCLKIPVHEKQGQNVTVDVCHQDVLSRHPIIQTISSTLKRLKIKHPKDKTSHRKNVPIIKCPKYDPSKLQNVLSHKTSQLQNVPKTKCPRYKTSKAANHPKYKMSQDTCK